MEQATQRYGNIEVLNQAFTSATSEQQQIAEIAALACIMHVRLSLIGKKLVEEAAMVLKRAAMRDAVHVRPAWRDAEGNRDWASAEELGVETPLRSLLCRVRRDPFSTDFRILAQWCDSMGQDH